MYELDAILPYSYSLALQAFVLEYLSIICLAVVVLAEAEADR